jgi:hypothetical protein
MELLGSLGSLCGHFFRNHEKDRHVGGSDHAVFGDGERDTKRKQGRSKIICELLYDS